MTGLMWFDNRPGVGLVDRLGTALKRHVEKFGRPANLVLVHPSMIDEPRDLEVGGEVVRVEPAEGILVHHMLVGEGDR